MIDNVAIAARLAEFVSAQRPTEDIFGTRPEKPYQLWLARLIGEWLAENYPGQFRLKAEPKGGGIVPVKMFGTSFWPDLAVETVVGDLVLGIEVKCLNRRDLPDLVSQALGQAVIYREAYDRSLVIFVLIEDLIGPSDQLRERISGYDVAFAVVPSFRTTEPST